MERMQLHMLGTLLRSTMVHTASLPEIIGTDNATVVDATLSAYLYILHARADNYRKVIHAIGTLLLQRADISTVLDAQIRLDIQTIQECLYTLFPNPATETESGTGMHVQNFDIQEIVTSNLLNITIDIEEVLQAAGLEYRRLESEMMQKPAHDSDYDAAMAYYGKELYKYTAFIHILQCYYANDLHEYISWRDVQYMETYYVCQYPQTAIGDARSICTACMEYIFARHMAQLLERYYPYNYTVIMDEHKCRNADSLVALIQKIIRSTANSPTAGE